MTARRVADVLRRIADAVEHMSDSEMEAFIVGLRDVRPKRRRLPLRKSIRPNLKELETLAAQLQQLPTREDGLNFLDHLQWTRDDLAHFAKIMSVHITKDDTNSRIKAKLVETAIGSRLSSSAIRGKV